jgi:excisionase family DNA binding protein
VDREIKGNGAAGVASENGARVGDETMDHYRDNLNQGLPAEGQGRTNPDGSRTDSEPPDAVFQPTSSPRKGVFNDADSPLYRLLTVGEVAALLNVPRKWVYRRVGLKPPEGIPYLKVGKYLRFRESDLREYVERLRRN